MTITHTREGYEVRFKFHPRIVADMQNIPQARWVKSREYWHVPVYRNYYILELARKYGVVMHHSVEIPEQVGEIPELPYLTTPIVLNKPLRKYQERGVARAMQLKRVLIGDEPGVGKTAEAIATAVGLKAKCILVICPNTLKYNWEREWMMFAGRRSIILSPKYKSSWQDHYKVGLVNVFICNYESLKTYFVVPGWKIPRNEKGGKASFKTKDIPFRDNIKLFDCVIIDEFHNSKEENSLQSKIVMGIAREKPIRILLSGTPVINRPFDLFAPLVIANRLQDLISHIPEPIDLDGKGTDPTGKQRFLERYCDGKYDGSSNERELNLRLWLTCFFRRAKEDVLSELPTKLRQVVLCELTNQKEYDDAERAFIQSIKEIKASRDPRMEGRLKGQFFTRLSVLRQLTAKGKLETAKQYIDEVVSNGKKIVVFVYHVGKGIVADLLNAYPDALTIIGSNTPEERDRAILLFQTDPSKKIIVCSIKAGGIGTTLTAASEVLLIEQPFTDALLEQAIDRTHRLGQLERVRAGILIARNTIDEYVYDEIITPKRILNTKIIEGEDMPEPDDIIDGLLSFFDRRQRDV